MSAFLLAIKIFVREIPWQAWLAFAVLVALVMSWVHAYNQGYDSGKTNVTNELREQSDDVEGRADAASNRVARCYATGGTWDRLHGVCTH